MQGQEEIGASTKPSLHGQKAKNSIISDSLKTDRLQHECSCALGNLISSTKADAPSLLVVHTDY